MKKKLLFSLLAMFAFTATYAQEEGEDEPVVQPVFTKALQCAIDDAKFIVASSHYTTGQATLQKAIETAEGNMATLADNDAVREELKTLQLAIDNFVFANGHVDATEKVMNASFDKTDGWTISNLKQNTRSAANYNTTRTSENPDVSYVIHNFVEQWSNASVGMLKGKGDCSQVVKGLPAGHYRLTADILVHNQLYNETCEEAIGVQLYAGDVVREVGITGITDTDGAAFSLDFDVAEGAEPTIGFRFESTNVNWIGWDNVTLYFIGDPEIYNNIVNAEKLAAAKEAIAASVSSANEALASEAAPFYRNELQTAIANANALTEAATLEEVNEAKELLDAELKTFNNYNKHYTALKTAIEKAEALVAGGVMTNGVSQFQEAIDAAKTQLASAAADYATDADGGAALCDEVLAALEKAESTFRVKNASYANPANLISNGKMSSIDGWDILAGGDANPNLHINTSGDVTNFSKPFMECWVNNTDYGMQNYARQTVNTMPDGSVLPSGFYILKCAALATRQDQADLKVSGVTLKFQDQQIAVQTANGIAKLYTIGFDKQDEGGELSFGLYIDEATDANWIAWDEVELQYVGNREKYYADYIQAVLAEKLVELQAAVDNAENALKDVDMEGIDFEETDLKFVLDDAHDILENPAEALGNMEGGDVDLDILINEINKNLAAFFASGVSPKAGKFFDYTSQIKNAEFDVAPGTEWTAAEGSDLPAVTEGESLAYWWFGSSTSYGPVQEFYQTLYNMAAGNYLLEANAAIRVDMTYDTAGYTAENLVKNLVSCQVYANDNYADVHPFFYEDEAKGLTLDKMLEMTNDWDYRHGNGTLTNEMLKESGLFKVYIPFTLESNGDIKLGFRLELPTLEDGTTKKNGQMPFIDYFHLYFFGKQEAQIPDLSGINDILSTPTADSQKVYNLRGQLVRTANGLEGLPKGLYIIGGKKYIVR